MTGKLEKCKQFLPFLKRAGKMQGLVEYVASGSRFRVYIPRETCIITFLLGGISCPRGSRQMPDGSKVEAEKFGDEAALHVKEMILQREVEIEVRGGGFYTLNTLEHNISLRWRVRTRLATSSATSSARTRTSQSTW